jgi:arsenate reductase-like glutaredoxin family protein
MKILKFNEKAESELFSITNEQLSELIEKVEKKIHGMLNKEGKSTKTLALSNSVSDTIKTYIKKHSIKKV